MRGLLHRPRSTPYRHAQSPGALDHRRGHPRRALAAGGGVARNTERSSPRRGPSPGTDHALALSRSLPCLYGQGVSKSKHYADSLPSSRSALAVTSTPKAEATSTDAGVQKPSHRCEGVCSFEKFLDCMARALAVVSKGTGPIKFRDGVALDTGARFPSSIECQPTPTPRVLALHRASSSSFLYSEATPFPPKSTKSNSHLYPPGFRVVHWHTYLSYILHAHEMITNQSCGNIK